MAETTHVLKGGLKLVRNFKDGANADARCGSLAQWNTWMEEMLAVPLVGYFSNSTKTSNKFLSKVTVRVFDLDLPFPQIEFAQAYCYDRNAGTSEIFIRYFTPTGDTYRFPGALSHELGHAWHNFAECYTLQPFAADFEKLWAIEASANDTTFDKTQKPYKDPWNTGNPDACQHPHEEFANAFRYFNGVNVTRGQSGPGTRDLVVPGFEDPAKRPDWGAMLGMLPETTGMIKTYGYKPGTLQWWPAQRQFLFQTTQNVWVGQRGPNTWIEYRWNFWTGKYDEVPLYPTYSRP